MHFINISPGETEKKWILGPWNSQSPVEIGYITEAKGTTHVHKEIFEYYLIARGSLTIRVEEMTIF